MQNWTGNTLVKVFMPLRSIVLEIWTCETKKSRNFLKIDLWPAITGSNIDLGPKIILPTASTRRAQSAGLFREVLRRFVWKRQGGLPPPPTPAKVAKHRLRARVKTWYATAENNRLRGGKLPGLGEDWGDWDWGEEKIERWSRFSRTGPHPIPDRWFCITHHQSLYAVKWVEWW